MADPAGFLKADFMKDFQSLAQQSWEAWTRQLQAQQSATANPFSAPPPASVPGSDTLERTLAGLKGYVDLLQGMAAGSAANQPPDWTRQLQQLFGAGTQPFAQAFNGIDSSGAEGFSRQWQAWLQAAQHAGIADLGGLAGASPTPAFGLSREQQMQQQALLAAMLASMQASARYQSLIQRVNAQGMEQLQARLAQAGPDQQVESLKALYDLWVDVVEKAYAEIALSDEFREAYGEMVNAQMRVRQLQQQQTEQLCQQLGVPTRSEVSSLGERLQALRREFRASRAGVSRTGADEIAELRRELAALRKQQGAAMKRKATKSTGPAARTGASGAKKVATKTPGKAASSKKASSKRAGVATSVSSRERK